MERELLRLHLHPPQLYQGGERRVGRAVGLGPAQRGSGYVGAHKAPPAERGAEQRVD